MTHPITVSLIVAMAENRTIGKNNDLPWRLPEDLKYFKRVTMGHPIIMGRKTYDSIGRPLPGRPNIVVSRQQDWSAEGVISSSSLPDALKQATALAEKTDANEVHIIGGAQLYGQAFDVVDRLYLTQVHANVDGDAFFPEVDISAWMVSQRQDFSADETNPFDYSFIVYDRP